MRPEGVPGFVVRAVGALPRGRALPDSVWRPRHAAILALLWAHVGALFLFALARGYEPLHAALEVGIVAASALIARVASLNRSVRAGIATFGLFTCSALLVHFSGGVTEMHFHFFVIVGVVALYQDWVPFLGGIAYVLLHHGILGAVVPEDVYGTPAAVENPWGWAAIHAGFILAASAASLVGWKKAEEHAEAIGAEALRRKEALQLNDHVVQGLVVAKASFELGDPEGGRRALDATLARAKSLVSDLMGEHEAEDVPGSFVRDRAATVEPA